MTDDLGQVESVCPECLRRLIGHLVMDGNEVRMEKSCPEHGPFSARVWQGEPTFSSWYRPKIPFLGGSRRAADKGCPFDCGLCANHGQRTCTALVEITSRCNLCCPVCFAGSGGWGGDIDLQTLARMFAEIMRQTGGCNLQLSGGEPTVRTDLPEIVRAATKAGFTFIQLNSNGLMLARDPDLAGRLRDQGLSSVFLQFDGVDDRVYRTLRGKKLFADKCRAIDHLAAAGLGIVLVPTLVRGVNTDQIGEIVRFGLERQPAVRGVHFQPISYFGRYPQNFVPDHFTLPEIIQALASQSRGLIKTKDFLPPGCEHALCSFSAKYLVEVDGRFTRLGGGPCDCTAKPAEEGALAAIGVTARHWGAIPKVTVPAAAQPADDLDLFLNRACSHTFTVSAMAFQDCWNLNLERLRGCCIHVAQPDGRLIPFCSFNLTDRGGRALHRPSSSIKAHTDTAKTTVDALVARRLGINVNGPLGRRELERRQLAALQGLLNHAMTNSPFYRQHLAEIDSRSLQSCADLDKLPLLTSTVLTQHGHLMLAVSQAKVARIVTMQTSGSTGSPKRLAFTAGDLQATLEFFLQGMGNLVGKDDRVMVLLPFVLPDSVGDLLIRALEGGGIAALGIWPPVLPPERETLEEIHHHRPTCLVGLPQHLLALAEAVGPGVFRSMLLSSDYAAPALRRRIEGASGCTTFLHYGSTETGLGGGVECAAHNGCHLRESELLLEIIDPITCRPLPDGDIGEVVLTTLGREAMPLIRYRTGDLARLDRSTCSCGGVTARLFDIRGRLGGCRMANGGTLCSPDLDDLLYHIPGLIDYRIILDRDVVDRLHGEFVITAGGDDTLTQIREKLLQLPAIGDSLADGRLTMAGLNRVSSFTVTHTIKRTILDLRQQGEKYAPRSL
jgi:uncharacterized radical SAM superfamily Fe-S cluster-containing enzyme/phenylacetate-coenzyme A ligase PaaK-like adenylate-forming protein